MKANKPVDVFRHINMHNGDQSVCWEWEGSFDKKGRPLFPLMGTKKIAYRLVYELVFGVSLTPEQLLLHQCDHPWCCNPYHVKIGTHQENMDEMKDRERHGLPKIVVNAIRTLAKDIPHATIAERYGVSRETVRDIVNERTHKES